MKKKSKHTFSAVYMLICFLHWEESRKLKIDALDVAILWVIYDFIDLGAYATITRIASIARVNRGTFMRRLKKLVELKLVTKDKLEGRNVYSIGETIRKFVRQQSRLQEENKCDRIGTTVSTESKPLQKRGPNTYH